MSFPFVKNEDFIIGFVVLGGQQVFRRRWYVVSGFPSRSVNKFITSYTAMTRNPYVSYVATVYDKVMVDQ